MLSQAVLMFYNCVLLFTRYFKAAYFTTGS